MVTRNTSWHFPCQASSYACVTGYPFESIFEDNDEKRNNQDLLVPAKKWKVIGRLRDYGCTEVNKTGKTKWHDGRGGKGDTYGGKDERPIEGKMGKKGE